MARTTWCHRPERFPSSRPERRPATERSLTGEARGQDADLRHVSPVDGGDVAEIGRSGPVAGEDAGGAGVALGVPSEGASQSALDAQVEAAVAGAQTPDQPIALARRQVIAHAQLPGRRGCSCTGAAVWVSPCSPRSLCGGGAWWC